PDADSDPSVEPCHDKYRLITLYFPGLPLSRWNWRAILMAASVTSEPADSNFTVLRSPGATSAIRLARRTAAGLDPCIGAGQSRGEVEGVELVTHRLDPPPVVMANRDRVDPRESVQVALAVHVPIENPIGLRHEQRVLRPLGHLVADEDLAEEPLLRRLGIG